MREPESAAGTGIRLADHIVFQELPFCGVLLDTGRFTVHRLSRRASHVLRTALDPGSPNPYAPLLPDGDEETAEQLRRQLLDRLEASGMVHRVPAGKALGERS